MGEGEVKSFGGTPGCVYARERAYRVSAYITPPLYIRAFFPFFSHSILEHFMMIENTLQSYNKAIEKALLVVRKNKTSFIGMAIFCLVLQQVYASFTVPPKHLRQYPKVSFLSMIRSFYIKESVANRTKRLVTPLTNAGHSFYVVSSFYICIYISP